MPRRSVRLTAGTARNEASNDKSFDNVSGSFTVAYQATDEINTYFRYGNGYRSGGFNGEAFNSAPFEEETIDQYEIGAKSELWDGRLRINGALYTYTYDDLQVSTIETVNGTPTTNIDNAGKAERWGGELEVLVAPIDDLVVGLSYAYIHGDFDEFPDLCGTNVPDRPASKVKISRSAEARPTTNSICTPTIYSHVPPWVK